MMQVNTAGSKWIMCCVIVGALLLNPVRASDSSIAQTPLSLGQASVPGNLILTPSVEYPTVLSFANLGNTYDETQESVGYFDSAKCYRYSYNATDESQRHFYPQSAATDFKCTESNLWSGNFLNWAATQTIDPFRWALTGGYRVKDTPTETWLEKARHTGQESIPNRSISGGAAIRGATPFGTAEITTVLNDKGSEMHFILPVNHTEGNVERDYRYVGDWTEDVKNDDGEVIGTVHVGDTYAVTVRVKVCDAAQGLENNCVQYGENWKPEGLIQRYANQLRYSIFGYLNDGHQLRDGGVLRARQKWVGPTDPDVSDYVNNNREWDPDTGVFVQNPDPDDVNATNRYYGTNIADSGVINYLNKFGQLNDNQLKGFDPVSELYYTALRYIKNQGNVEAYYTRSPTHNRSPDSTEITKWVDNFPVIQQWRDPIQSSCQKNVILGIGDIFTHKDKNLPGNTSRIEEPAKPREVSADTVDVRELTDKIALLEGISVDTGAGNYNGNNNSAFMAGLAYHANTEDIRPGGIFLGKQTVQTYWVDVLEKQHLRSKRSNQYWLAAKYGGFVPRKDPRCSDAGYIPAGNECDEEQVLGHPDNRTAPLPEWWWYTNTDVLTSTGWKTDPVETYKRTDNYYTAGDARKMVDGLTAAFADIADSITGAASGLGSTSKRLTAGTALFNGLMESSRWSGDLEAWKVDSTGTSAQGRSWSAAQVMDGLSEQALDARKIFTSVYSAPTTGTGETLHTGGTEFTWSGLSSVQHNLLKTSASGGLTTETVGRERLAYLRGSRIQEQSLTNTARPFRQRGSRLGGITNSSPEYIARKNYRFDRLGSAFGDSVRTAYKAYRASQIYQTKPPIVLAGANDGMLHAFDARLDVHGGKELFAYVPNGVFNRLAELTYPGYRHRYYVDGPAAVSDAWFAPDEPSQGVPDGWKTVAAVTPGAGGKGVSLLDISDPADMTKEDVLWEFSHEDMGAMIQQPTITAFNNGRFGVVVSSGFHADNLAREGSVWILNVANGAVMKRFTLPDAGGLGQPLLLDLNGDKIADRIIVGDTRGNIWRLDIRQSDVSHWGVPASLKVGTLPVPLFIAKDAAGNRQPVTAPVNAGFDARNRLMVLFGTGSYYLTSDAEVGTNPQVQTLYGIVDAGVPVNDRSQLLQQEIIWEARLNGDDSRVITENTISPAQKGWYLDLAWLPARRGPGGLGELINTQVTLQFGQELLVDTVIPSVDPCIPGGGSSWQFSLDYNSGAGFNKIVFDYNRDGQFTEDDLVEVPITDANGNVIRVELRAPSAVRINGENNSINNSIVVTGRDADGSPLKLLCSNNSGTNSISCLKLNAQDNSGRIGWREVR